MNTLITILFIILGIIALLFLAAFFMRKKYTIEREIVIDAPLSQVFDYIKLLKNQDYYNKWVMVEPDMQKDFQGTDGTTGFVYGWNGKKAGEGEQEITAMTEGEKIDTEIRFIRPFVSTAHTSMKTESLSENQTKLIWRNDSAMKYPMNLMVPLIEKMLPKDMDLSLNNLKRILESR